jgi:hypothetical protein
MYVVDESSYFDHQLTHDFCSFWTAFGLPDFPLNVSNYILHCSNKNTSFLLVDTTQFSLRVDILFKQVKGVG